MYYFKFLHLAVENYLRSQKLIRIPEPESITDDPLNVADYNQALMTKMSLVYSQIINIFPRVTRQKEGGHFLDLACGPGLLTLAIAKYLKFETVTGIDLSENMLTMARENAKKDNLENLVQLKKGDITKLNDYKDNSIDASLWANGPHQLPNMDSVSKTVEQMDRITKKEGVIFIWDVCRLKTKKVTNKFLDLITLDSQAQGLHEFYKDTVISWFAAWTGDELKKAYDSLDDRNWVHFVTTPVPFSQVIIGFPKDQKKAFLRAGTSTTKSPFIKNLYPEWVKKNGKIWAFRNLWDIRLSFFKKMN